MSAGRWLAVLAALVAFAAMTASAASLGGLSARSLGANRTVVVPCDTTSIAISYLNEFDVATETYRSVEVTLGDVSPACDGLQFRLTLASPTASLRELVGTIRLNGGTRHPIALSPSIASASITRTSLVVTG